MGGVRIAPFGHNVKVTGEGVPVESDLPAERKARREIDEMLRAAGWVMQDRKELNLSAGRGVAVREVPLEAVSPARSA